MKKNIFKRNFCFKNTEILINKQKIETIQKIFSLLDKKIIDSDYKNKLIEYNKEIEVYQFIYILYKNN